MDHAGNAPPDGGAPRRFHADQTSVGVNESGERPGRVRAATHARHDDIRVAAQHLAALPAGLIADDALELTHHPRIGMGTGDRAEAVMGVVNGRDPVAQRLVDGVLQRPAPRVHGMNFRPEQPHTEHVERLALGVDLAHVDVAPQPEQRRRRRSGHPVLPGSRLGDDALLAHRQRQQSLTDHVVDLV